MFGTFVAPGEFSLEFDVKIPHMNIEPDGLTLDGAAALGAKYRRFLWNNRQFWKAVENIHLNHIRPILYDS